MTFSHLHELTKRWNTLLVVAMLEREIPRSGPISFRLRRRYY